MQLNFQGGQYGPGVYKNCIIVMDTFDNLFSLEKAADMLAEVDCNDPTSAGVKVSGYATESCATLDVAALKSCDFRCTSTSRFIKAMRICCNSFQAQAGICDTGWDWGL